MYLSQFPITSGYGRRGDGFHHGVDFATPNGTPIPALVSGTVVFEGAIPAAAPGYSDEIICIVQSDGFFVVYGHLSATLVNRGQRVEQGQIIARSGNTGYSTGPHLHVEQRHGTKDPAKGINAYTSTNITPLLQAYGQKEDNMKARTLVDALYKIAQPNVNPSAKVRDDHASYITSMNTEQLAKWVNDFLEVGIGYLSARQAVNELYDAMPYEASAEVREAKVGAIQSGLSFSQLIQEAVPNHREEKERLQALTRELEGKIMDLSTQLSRKEHEVAEKILQIKHMAEDREKAEIALREVHRMEINKLKQEKHDIDLLLKKAQQNAKPVERWTWQQHLRAAINKLFHKEVKTQ